MKLKLESEQGLICDVGQKPLQFSILTFYPAFQGKTNKQTKQPNQNLLKLTNQKKPPKTPNQLKPKQTQNIW